MFITIISLTPIRSRHVMIYDVLAANIDSVTTWGVTYNVERSVSTAWSYQTESLVFLHVHAAPRFVFSCRPTFIFSFFRCSLFISAFVCRWLLRINFIKCVCAKGSIQMRWLINSQTMQQSAAHYSAAAVSTNTNNLVVWQGTLMPTTDSAKMPNCRWHHRAVGS